MDETAFPEDDGRSVDWSLEDRINGALHAGAHLFLTLSVHGVVVTGQVVSEDDYFLGCAKAESDAIFAQALAADEPGAAEGPALLLASAEVFAARSRTRQTRRSLQREQHMRSALDDLSAQGTPVADELADLYMQEASAEQLEFVHLKDARIMQPGVPPLPTQGGLWWRCRVDAIDGFAVGQLLYSAPSR